MEDGGAEKFISNIRSEKVPNLSDMNKTTIESMYGTEEQDTITIVK